MKKALLILFFPAFIIILFSCKKQDVKPSPSENVSKKFFYLEEISDAGDTSRTPVVVVN